MDGHCPDGWTDGHMTQYVQFLRLAHRHATVYLSLWLKKVRLRMRARQDNRKDRGKLSLNRTHKTTEQDKAVLFLPLAKFSNK